MEAFWLIERESPVSEILVVLWRAEERRWVQDHMRLLR